MHAQEWFEDDAYWKATYDFMFPDEKFPSAAANVPKIVALTGCAAGSVLDLCCGPGRYAVPLAKNGYAVTGVDRTPFLLEKAKSYATTERVEVEWIQEDMRRFVRSNAFDLALSVFTSFGYFDDFEENRLVLKNIHTSLNASGVLLMDMNGKELLAGKFHPTQSHAMPNGDLLIQRVEVIRNWSRINNEWIRISGDRVQRFTIQLWLFSARELEQLLLDVGFSSVKIFGDFEQTAYGPGARRLVAVAHK